MPVNLLPVIRLQQSFVKGGNGKVTTFSKEELLRTYIGDNDDYIIYNSVWSKLFAREIVEGVQFPKGRNSEDIMYTTKAFCKADRGVYIDKCFYNYVLDRDGSIMNVKRGERMFNDELPFWREHHPECTFSRLPIASFRSLQKCSVLAMRRSQTAYHWTMSLGRVAGSRSGLSLLSQALQGRRKRLRRPRRRCCGPMK